jgi:hypothetical protein
MEIVRCHAPCRAYDRHTFGAGKLSLQTLLRRTPEPWAQTATGSMPLRRVAKDRAATPAEKTTARRLAKALAAKIGKRPGRSRRRGPSAALPEPPAARWRRQWIAWLEAVLDKITVAGSWVHVIWIASLIGLVLMLVFGTEAARREGRRGLSSADFWGYWLWCCS